MESDELESAKKEFGAKWRKLLDETPKGMLKTFFDRRPTEDQIITGPVLVNNPEIKILNELIEEIRKYCDDLSRPLPLQNMTTTSNPKFIFGYQRGSEWAIHLINKKIKTLESYQSEKGNAKFAGDMKTIDFFDPVP